MPSGLFLYSILYAYHYFHVMLNMKLLLFLLPIVLISCGSNLESISETNDLGYKTIYTIDSETKLKEGIQKVYDSNGNLYEELNHLAGKINGTRTLYFPNGNKEVVENLLDGVYHGIFQSFYEEGPLKTEGKYENNVAIGEWKSYYKSGQLKDIANFENNEENGPFVEYHANGKLKAEGNYKNGDNEDGLLLLYDEEGQLEKKMDCNLGRCSTVWKKTEQNS